MELFQAHSQWAKRPDDERFTSIDSLYKATKEYADTAQESEVPYETIRTEAVAGDVVVVGRKNHPARLTHWAFGQLASRVGAPAAYLRNLPPTLAVQNLNHGLAHRVSEYGTDDTAKLLFHKNGDLLLRSITSDKYSRFWNYEVAQRLLGLQEQGWEPAVPDVRSIEGKEHALYASDHDMFAFLRFKKNTIAEAGTDQPIYRGAIVWNSEVGAASLGGMTFLYRYMCGNHIIWGASQVFDFSVRHIGNALQRRFKEFAWRLRQYAEDSSHGEEAKIAKSKESVIGSTKEEVLDVLFGKRSLGLSRKVLTASYEATVPDQDGDPNTVWGFVQGLTRHSQTLPYADERTKLDRAAGKIIEADF